MIVVPDCGTPSQIYGINHSENMPCPNNIGDSVLVDLTNYVFSSLPIDWTTFQFIPSAGQTVSGNTLTGLLGDATFGVGNILTYTSTANIPSEVVQWSVCNTGGACAPAITFTYLTNCPTAPVAVNDTACAVCGQTTVPINVVSNDTGVSNPYVISIVTYPTYGSVVVNPNGTLNYTPNANYSGNDTIVYNVTNSINGQVSNNATLTISVACAGTDANFTACN